MQNTAFAYKERGWMKGSTSNEFSMQLNYVSAEGTAVAQYNRNISNQKCGSGTVLPNVYSYTYDGLNRLKKGISTGTVMSEELTYDVMGNISTLNRDNTGANVYSYTGNRLSSVANVTAQNYAYDANGNATLDGRNGMTLAYNYLNLPATATKAGTSVTYTYDASGKKLTKNSNGTLRQYVDGIEYSGNAIDIIHTEEGIAQNSGGNYSYHYNLTDHLGNVRYTFDIYNGAVRRLQADDYYAFGKRRSASPVSLDNKYLYNGKEVQDELGEQYDYGARFYDPVIGRWNVVDAMSGIYPSESPYAFTGNSPINFVDEGGLFKISAQFARMYPTLTRMLKYYLPMLKDNPVVRNAFIKTTGMGGEFFDQMVSYNSGPWIVPSRYDLQNTINFTDPAYQSGSKYRPDYNEENLYIEGDKLAALERAFKLASTSRKGNELGFWMFVTSMTIMHEAAHYGFFKKHGLEEARRSGAFGREIGAEFEGRAYKKFSYGANGGAMDIEKMRDFYNLHSSSPDLGGMTLMPNLGNYNFNRFFLKEVKAPEPSQDPSGQDPHINPKPSGH